MIKVCKFGGTSTADAIALLRMKKIIEQDPCRRYVIVSAPGKRYGNDSKITDLLYEAHASVLKTGSCGSFFLSVRKRFRYIAYTLGLRLDIERLLDETERKISEIKEEAFTVSRGEYLTGRIAAELLQIPFLDAYDLICFRQGRLCPEETNMRIASVLEAAPRAVIPGFYGRDASGKVATFSRGGSDVTGALVARAVGAALYENWTDVSGFYACDPRIVDSPEKIRTITYRELRELSHMGASVLHDECVFPVREAGIPILVKNTFRPEEEGTLILPALSRKTGREITGLAGKKNFVMIGVERSFIGREVGFMRQILGLLERHSLSLAHLASGMDALFFVLKEEELCGGALEGLLSEVRALTPCSVSVRRGISLIAAVGQTDKSAQIAARLFGALARIGVNARVVVQNAASNIVGVDDPDFERTLKSVYEEFFS